MATVSSRVQAIFSANAGGLTAGVRDAEKSVARFQRQMLNMQQSLKNISTISTINLFGNIAASASRALGRVKGLAVDGFQFLTAAIQDSSDVAEELNKAGEIFGSYAKDVESFAKSANRLGLSTKEAFAGVSDIGNLLSGFGIADKELASMSIKLGELAADMASFNNASPEETLRVLGAAIRGESEGISRFGVVMNEATVKAKALGLGLTKDLKETLDPTSKAMARFAVIMEGTTKQLGDATRTSDSLANMQRQITASLADIKVSVGETFEPLLNAATNVFRDILIELKPVFSEISNAIKPFIEQIKTNILSLKPDFLSWVKGLDGETIGLRLKASLIDGAIFLTKSADSMISGLTGVFNFLSSIAAKVAAVGDTFAILAEALNPNSREKQIQAAIEEANVLKRNIDALQKVAATATGARKDELLEKVALRQIELDRKTAAVQRLLNQPTKTEAPVLKASEFLQSTLDFLEEEKKKTQFEISGRVEAVVSDISQGGAKDETLKAVQTNTKVMADRMLNPPAPLPLVVAQL